VSALGDVSRHVLHPPDTQAPSPFGRHDSIAA
jgi:hypothetical protein